VHINTRHTTSSKILIEEIEKTMAKLEYSRSFSEKEIPKILELRKKILKLIDKNQPFDELEAQFKELKEQQFIKEHGMGSKEYEQKLDKERYECETVTTRECLCSDCFKTFESDRLHSDCSHCGKYQYFTLERDANSNLIGKVIESVFRSPQEELIIFTDGTYHKNSIGGYY
jgi:hypothetical protein